MNMLDNQKIRLLVQQIETQDLNILHAATHNHEGIIRNILDHRRQLLALLERELMAETRRETAFVDDVYVCNQDILNFIKIWCNQIKRTSFTPENLLDEDYCHQVVDAYVPLSWDWTNDLIILIHPTNELIFDVFANRGQKNLVAICESEDVIAQNKISQKFKNCFVVSDYLELADRISRINTRVRQVVTLHCDPQNKNSPETLEKVQEALKLGRKSAQISVNTNARFSNSWSMNILQNLKSMRDCHHLSQVKVNNVNCAVVVSPGPSLEKNVKLLKDVQDDVFIVTVLRAVGILERHGIRPDLVVQVDALTEKEATFLAKNSPTNISNLFLEGVVNPALFELQADRIIYSLMSRLDSVHALLGTEPTSFTAPSVSIYATNLCRYFGIRSICLLGQDLAAQDGISYAAGATDHLLDLHAEIPFDIPVPGFWGGTVYTRSDFSFYIEQYSTLTAQWKSEDPNLQLVNATEGGAFIDGFDHMTFKDYLSVAIPYGPAPQKSIVFGDKTETSLGDVDRFLLRTGNLLSKIMTTSEMIIKLDQLPEKSIGTQKKIKKLIKQFSKLNAEVEFLEIAMQQEISETVGNAKTTSTIPTYSNFFNKVRNVSRGLHQAVISQT